MIPQASPQANGYQTINSVGDTTVSMINGNTGVSSTTTTTTTTTPNTGAINTATANAFTALLGGGNTPDMSSLLALITQLLQGMQGNTAPAPAPAAPAPRATDDNVTIPMNTAVRINVLANDPGGNANTVQGFTQPLHGSVTKVGNDLIYTPVNGFQGNDSFSYTNSNGAVAKVNVNVGGAIANPGTPATGNGGLTTTPTINAAPVAKADTASTAANTPVTVNVLANDTDANGDPLSVSNFSQPANGTVSRGNANNLIYTPKPGFSGTDTFSYTAADGKGGFSTTSVSVAVAAPAVAPAPAPTPVAPTPVPAPAPIKAGATIWGDPHFVGADGEKYDVQGKAGKTYNILSDAGFQLNSTFQAYGGGGATTMGKVGASIGKDQVQIDGNGALKINGETKKDGTYAVDGGTVTKKGANVTMKTAEYEVTARATGGYLNLDFKSGNVAADGVMPKGLWGQTADGDGKARVGSGQQGGGVLEKLDGTLSAKGDTKTVTLYEVDGLFDTDFANFNRFKGNTNGTQTVIAPVAANGTGE